MVGAGMLRMNQEQGLQACLSPFLPSPLHFSHWLSNLKKKKKVRIMLRKYFKMIQEMGKEITDSQ